MKVTIDNFASENFQWTVKESRRENRGSPRWFDDLDKNNKERDSTTAELLKRVPIQKGKATDNTHFFDEIKEQLKRAGK